MSTTADRGSATERRSSGDGDGVTQRLVWPQWIAEFIPRQVMHLRQLLAGFPLLGG